MDNSTGGPGPPNRQEDNLQVRMETEAGTDTGLSQQENNRGKESNMGDGNSQDRVNLIDFENRYTPTDYGPFSVYVEHTNKHFGKLFPIRIGHYLKINSQFKNSILDIKSVGINRVKVILNSYKAANSLVNNNILTSQGFQSYIPKFYTQRKGIIRMVDTFFTEQYLISEIECEKEVKDVKRMKKWITDRGTGERKLVDRQIVIVSFAGSNLPLSVRINGVNFPVEPYIYPVVQCLRCLIYGHTAKQCKSTKAYCKKCAGEHENNTDCLSDTVFCKYCKTNDHSSIAKTCPYYQKQRRIKQIMSVNNVSFKEAETVDNNPSYAKVATNNRFDILANMRNFPPLPQVQNDNQRTPQIHKPKGRNQTIHRQATQPTQTQKTSGNKRRDISRSPSPETRKAPKSSTTILPNPHRLDFVKQREELASQITSFIDNLIRQVIPEQNNVDFLLEQLKIRDTINQYFSNLSNSNPNNDVTSDEEY